VLLDSLGQVQPRVAFDPGVHRVARPPELQQTPGRDALLG
jgi:hypothetical protein